MNERSITEILEEIEAPVFTSTHDSLRDRFGLRRPQGRDDAGGDRSGPQSLPEDLTRTLQADPVNHPLHYVSHPSGVECIIITEWMSFNLGNAVKYIWRSNDKGATLQDLEKARWYLEREISRLKRMVQA